jgi:hypothetical protein
MCDVVKLFLDFRCTYRYASKTLPVINLTGHYLKAVPVLVLRIRIMLMRIRILILLVPLMRIWIQILLVTLMRIRILPFPLRILIQVLASK